jgi:hypothetical protein
MRLTLIEGIWDGDFCPVKLDNAEMKQTQY